MPYSCYGCGHVFEPSGSTVGLYCAQCDKENQVAKPKWEINAYQAHEDGTLTIYLEDFGPTRKDKKDPCMQVTVPAHDVPRMMVAGIDALRKKPSTR